MRNFFFLKIRPRVLKTSDRFGEMFEGDFAEKCTKTIPLVPLVGRVSEDPYHASIIVINVCKKMNNVNVFAFINNFSLLT